MPVGYFNPRLWAECVATVLDSVQAKMWQALIQGSAKGFQSERQHSGHKQQNRPDMPPQ